MCNFDTCSIVIQRLQLLQLQAKSFGALTDLFLKVNIVYGEMHDVTHGRETTISLKRETKFIRMLWPFSEEHALCAKLLTIRYVCEVTCRTDRPDEWIDLTDIDATLLGAIANVFELARDMRFRLIPGMEKHRMKIADL